jgi:hypothetical protein
MEWWKKSVFGSSRLTWGSVIGMMTGSFVGWAILVPWLGGRVRPVWFYFVVTFGIAGALVLTAAIEMMLRRRRTRG